MKSKQFDRVVQLVGGIAILAILAFLVTQGEIEGSTIVPLAGAVLAALGLGVGYKKQYQR